MRYFPSNTPGKDFLCSSVRLCHICTCSLALQQPSCDEQENCPKGKADVLRMTEWKARENLGIRVVFKPLKYPTMKPHYLGISDF